MKNVMIRNGFILLVISLLVGWNSLSAQNTGDNGRYKLAIYATGSQNGQPLEPDLLGMAQNRVITKLTNEGNYRMIERSDAFLKQIQNEQVMQQSGEVAEEQMVEIGKSYGADKICVVSITILDKYKSLYIATRIVDVETKTSYESGDAQVFKFKSNSMQVLMKTLEEALNKMLAVSNKKNIAPTTPTKPVETPKNAKTTSDIPTQQEASPKSDVTIQQETAPKPSDLSSDSPAQTEITPRVEKVSSNVPTQSAISNVPSQQSSNLTVAEVRAEKERAKVLAKAEATNAEAEFNAGFKAYKDRVRKEKGGFLEVNSMAYKKYRLYKANMISGAVLFSVGAGLFIGGMVAQHVGGHYSKPYLLECFPSYAFPEESEEFNYHDFLEYCQTTQLNYYYDIVNDSRVTYCYLSRYYGGERCIVFDMYSFWHLYEFGYMWSVGLGLMVTGLIQLCCLNHPLKKSYQYYINGDQKTATLQFHPYIGGNHTFGAGLTLRF